MTDKGIIHIAVALIINPRGEMLTVRKRGTDIFMQPGGKIDTGETPLEALVRELQEELALQTAPEDFRHEGTFSEKAANEPGMVVHAEAYSLLAYPEITAQAEIAETRWLPLNGHIDVKRAALSRDHLFPVARQRFAELEDAE